MTQELRTRMTWGIGAATVVLISILFLGAEITFLFSLILSLLGWHEYARMMGLRERPLLWGAGFVFVFLAMCHAFFLGTPNLVLDLVRTPQWLWTFGR